MVGHGGTVVHTRNPKGGTMVMYDHGKSDSSILPEKLPNKGCGAPRSAEEVEGRELAKGNLVQQNKVRTQ